VIAPIAGSPAAIGWAKPLVGHLRGEPNSSGSCSYDVIQALCEPLEVTAMIEFDVLRLVFPITQVIVGRIPVCKTIGDQKVDDLTPPIG
jgi:hypothetical protein